MIKVIMTNGDLKKCNKIEFFHKLKSNSALLVTNGNDFETEKTEWINPTEISHIIESNK